MGLGSLNTCSDQAVLFPSWVTYRRVYSYLCVGRRASRAGLLV